MDRTADSFASPPCHNLEKYLLGFNPPWKGKKRELKSNDVTKKKGKRQEEKEIGYCLVERQANRLINKLLNTPRTFYYLFLIICLHFFFLWICTSWSSLHTKVNEIEWFFFCFFNSVLFYFYFSLSSFELGDKWWFGWS